MDAITVHNDLEAAVAELDDIRAQLRQAMAQIRTARFYDLISTRRVGVGADEPIARVIELSEGWVIIHWRHDGRGIGLFASLLSLRLALLIGKERMLSLIDASERHLTPKMSRLAATRTELTSREQQALTEMSRGLSNKQVAQNMGLSESRVKTILSAGFDKLGVNTRAEAALIVRDLAVPDP